MAALSRTKNQNRPFPKLRHRNEIAIDLIQAPLEQRQFVGAADVKSKTDQIRNAWAAGEQIGALRIAAQFFDRSDATKTISLVWMRTGTRAFTARSASNRRNW
jgi:hypothetical protein